MFRLAASVSAVTWMVTVLTGMALLQEPAGAGPVVNGLREHISRLRGAGLSSRAHKGPGRLRHPRPVGAVTLREHGMPDGPAAAVSLVCVRHRGADAARPDRHRLSGPR